MEIFLQNLERIAEHNIRYRTGCCVQRYVPSSARRSPCGAAPRPHPSRSCHRWS